MGGGETKTVTGNLPSWSGTKAMDETPSTTSDTPSFSILAINHRTEEKDIRDGVDKPRSPLPSASGGESVKNSTTTTTTISTKSRSKSTSTKERKDKRDKKEKKHPKGKPSADASPSKATRQKKETIDVPDITRQALDKEDKLLTTTTRETQEHLKRILDGANTLVAPASSTKTHSTKSKAKKNKGESKDTRKQKQSGDEKEKQSNSPSKTARKKEETRKRREPLMLSPFDYLQVKHFEPPQDDCSVFPDDISHLTLPIQLQELEKKHHKMPSLLCFLEEEKTVPYPSSKVASLLGGNSPEVEPDPGWSRKSRSRSRRRSKSLDTLGVDETPRSTASTQCRLLPCRSFDASHTPHPFIYWQAERRKNATSPPQRRASPSPSPIEKKRLSLEDSSPLLLIPEIPITPDDPKTPTSHGSGSIAAASSSFPAKTKSFVSRSAHTDESDVETGVVDNDDAEIVIIRVREDRPVRHNIDEDKPSLFYPCAYSIMGFLMIVIISAILVIFLTPEEDSAG